MFDLELGFLLLLDKENVLELKSSPWRLLAGLGFRVEEFHCSRKLTASQGSNVRLVPSVSSQEKDVCPGGDTRSEWPEFSSSRRCGLVVNMSIDF